MPIESINLSLSNRCTADCVFCPASRGTKHNQDMSFEVVKKIIDEIAAPSFPWKVRRCQVGENGDAPLNKDFIKILHYIREHLPGMHINMATNFSQMKRELSETILRDRLIHGIQVNIDGHDVASYFAQKRLKHDLVMRNLKAFIELRAQINPSFDLGIHVLTLADYVASVKKVFGSDAVPTKLAGEVPQSSYEQVVASLRTFVPDDICIDKSGHFLWAERALVRPDPEHKTLSCPNLSRVFSEAFIAPNGDWYPCCYDDNQDLSYGSVMDSSLVTLHNSTKRILFIQDLYNHNYENIGYPCTTIQCCQGV